MGVQVVDGHGIATGFGEAFYIHVARDGVATVVAHPALQAIQGKKMATEHPAELARFEEVVRKSAGVLVVGATAREAEREKKVKARRAKWAEKARRARARRKQATAAVAAE